MREKDTSAFKVLQHPKPMELKIQVSLMLAIDGILRFAPRVKCTDGIAPHPRRPQKGRWRVQLQFR